MLELHITNQDITGGSIPVSWCISKELLAYFVANKIEDPLIVFTLSPDKDYSIAREIRKIVPLSDLMTYLDFRSSGNHTIHAFITTRPRKDAREKYLHKDNGEYFSNILNDDGDAFGQFVSSITDIDLLKAAPVSISIPQECFATQPPAWERVWVNHFFSRKPDDQCNYRRRRLFAYLVQPFIILAFSILKCVFLAIGFLYLSRGLSFKYLLHPLTYSLEDSCFDVLKGGSYLIRQLPEDEMEREDHPLEGDSFWKAISFILRKCGLLIFSPGLLLIVSYLWYHHRLLQGAEVLGGVLLFLLLVIGFVAIFVDHNYLKVWTYLLDLIDQRFHSVPIQAQDLVCDGKTKPVKKLTIKLLYQGIKNKICKPFAR